VCNLYSINTNQAAIIALFRVMNRYVGNLAPMPGVFPDYKAPIVRNGTEGRELTTARWGIPLARDVALAIRSKIKEVTGLNASAGISYNKFLAKLASDHRKPNGQYVITPERGPASWKRCL
jgi:nucleotidyltransferase/DNA polymerase involved in DNA repair